MRNKYNPGDLIEFTHTYKQAYNKITLKPLTIQEKIVCLVIDKYDDAYGMSDMYRVLIGGTVKTIPIPLKKQKKIGPYVTFSISLIE